MCTKQYNLLWKYGPMPFMPLELMIDYIIGTDKSGGLRGD